MKKIEFNLALFLGYCVIGIAIVIAGILISNRVPPDMQGHFTGHFSGNIRNNNDEISLELPDFFGIATASSYLAIPSHSLFELIRYSGEMQGTFTELGGTYIFSRERFLNWLESQMH